MRCRSLLALVILIYALSAPAYAEMRIIGSNSPQYQIGAVLADGTSIALGQGCFIRVLKLPSNETVMYEGPPKLKNLPPGGTRGKSQQPPC
jgi:hypothetical protein